MVYNIYKLYIEVFTGRNMSITFKVNQNKALEAVVYIATQNPGIDIYHTVKTIFYADKKHLNTYGRPILGDLYIKMENGSVPSLIKNIIDQDPFLSVDFLTKIKNSLEIKGRYKNITAKREPDYNVFSKSDIECIDYSLAFCKDKSFDQLKNMTHKEQAWIKASMNGGMDYQDMITNPEVLEDLSELGNLTENMVF